MKTIRFAIVSFGFLATLLVGENASAANLLAWETFVPDESLYSIDTSPPPTATFIGPAGGHGSPVGVIAEIEYRRGVVYGADTGTNTQLHRFDPSTGSLISTLSLTFPAEGDVLTALEFVGGTLYAGLTTEGGGPTYLSTVNLGTGVVSTIGATGVGSPFGGLAYQTTTGTMYAISSGGSAAELFTVHLGSGAATSVGLVTLGGTALADGTTALEFGSDGVLYSLTNRFSNLAGHLLSIDPSSAVATDLGDILNDGGTPVALTSVPEPSSMILAGVALLGLFGAAIESRRRLG